MQLLSTTLCLAPLCLRPRLWSSCSSRNNSSFSGPRASQLRCTSCPGRSSSGPASAPPPWRSVAQVPPPETIKVYQYNNERSQIPIFQILERKFRNTFGKLLCSVRYRIQVLLISIAKKNKNTTKNQQVLQIIHC